jgi:hypothetical protein
MPFSLFFIQLNDSFHGSWIQYSYISVCYCNLQYFTLLDGQAEHFSPHKVAAVLHVLAGVGDPLERDKAEVHVHPKFDSVLQAT